MLKFIKDREQVGEEIKARKAGKKSEDNETRIIALEDALDKLEKRVAKLEKKTT